MSFTVIKSNGMYNPNLLVDGEFQIWQEGNEKVNTPDKTSYLSTMWSVSDSAIVKAKKNNDKGIKIISYTGEPPCHIQYLFEENFLQNGEKYMLSCVINGNKYTLPITAGTSISNERLGYTADKRVYVRLNVNDVCDYVKLEQGEIDTPLIHEDYRKALYDTLYYFEIITVTNHYGFLEWFNKKRDTIVLSAPIYRKRTKPTLKGNWTSWTFRSAKSSQVTNGRYEVESYASNGYVDSIKIRESYTTSLPESEGEVFIFSIIGDGNSTLNIDARIY